MSQPRFTMLGLGEALFDIFPQAQVLGGAPLNAAVHAHQLARHLGGQGVVVSRVGQDALGSDLVTQLAERGLGTYLIQTDPDHDTGRVYVSIDDKGGHTFEIVNDVAYDWLQFDFDLETAARTAGALTFGTLAQRNAQCRNTIYRTLETARRAVRVYDVNLRQDFFDQRWIRRSFELANVVKLNTEELTVVSRLLGVRGEDAPAIIDKLLHTFKLDMLVLTRGQDGTVLHTPQGTFEGQRAHYPAAPGTPAPGADTVGAGDAVTAAVMLGCIMRWPAQRIADLANHAGAFVASQSGGTPALPDAIIDMTR